MGKVGVALAAGCAAAACVVAAVMVGRSVRRRRGWRRVVRVLEELEEGCATPVGRLRQVVDAMAVEMHAGLASEGGSKLKMLLTYVQNLPTGTEKGIYYALDLGGTNFRVLRVKLGGQRSAIIENDVDRQPIPQHLMTSTSEELFGFIASSLKDFVEREENVSEPSLRETRELGFTFSFPVKQISSSSGTLIKWTKGFSIQDMVGRDVSQCLQQEMSRKRLNIRVAALINDTVGTLALGHYHDEDTVAAVIFGTGTNACYLERADAIIKCQGLLSTTGGMVVNMEWGNFWSSHLPRTSYDVDLDGESPNPNDQGFEKMISGMYLGDIVRRVILRMSQESDVFGPVSSKLHVPFILRTPMVAAMHEDDSPNLMEVGRILRDTLQIPDVPLNVRKLVVKVCDVVTRRAARLAAAGIVGILKKIGRDGNGGMAGGKGKGGSQIKMRRTVVAVEGGLYTNYTMFREYLNEAVAQILGENVAEHVVIKVTDDGSVGEMGHHSAPPAPSPPEKKDLLPWPIKTRKRGSSRLALVAGKSKEPSTEVTTRSWSFTDLPPKKRILLRRKEQFKCVICGRVFEDYHALGGHKSQHRKREIAIGVTTQSCGMNEDGEDLRFVGD